MSSDTQKTLKKLYNVVETLKKLPLLKITSPPHPTPTKNKHHTTYHTISLYELNLLTSITLFYGHNFKFNILFDVHCILQNEIFHLKYNSWNVIY